MTWRRVAISPRIAADRTLRVRERQRLVVDSDLTFPVIVLPAAWSADLKVVVVDHWNVPVLTLSTPIASFFTLPSLVPKSNILLAI